MDFLRRKYASAPEYPRVAPFGIFVVLTVLQQEKAFGPASYYWLYVVKTVLVAWMLWEARSFVPEMRWKISLEAILVGILIFAVWVGLDGYYPRLAKLGKGWNPNDQFGPGSAAAWACIVFRIAGSSLVVPPIEELFYRSFLYRYFVKIDFRAMPLGQFHPLSFAVTSILFGLMHPEQWVAGILCGLAYQWLVVRNNRLGDAMTAHAITNFLLGIWVVWRQAWSFW